MVGEHGLTLPRKREQLDGLLAKFVEHLWSEGAGRAQACDTLAGLQDRGPKLKGHLQLSWTLLRTWSANEILNRAPPLPQKAILTFFMGILALVFSSWWASTPCFGLVSCVTPEELTCVHDWAQGPCGHITWNDQGRQTYGSGRECDSLQWW